MRIAQSFIELPDKVLSAHMVNVRSGSWFDSLMCDIEINQLKMGHSSPIDVDWRRTAYGYIGIVTSIES